MMLLYVLSAVVVAVSAQEMHQPNYDSYPEWYIHQPVQRLRRDVTVDHQVGSGRVFGTLGQNDNGLFGKAGYDHQIFNDGRGKLNGELYGSRVLGPNGDSSHFGGGLKWENPNAAASLDISRQIHGATSVQAAGGGRWPVGKNGDVTVQGTYGHTSGMKHDYGGLGSFNYRW